MLKQRLITAAVLIPFIVWAILVLPSEIVLMLFTAVAGLAAWEWLCLINIKSTSSKLIILACVVAAGIAMGFLAPPAWVLSVTALIWLLATLLVMFFAHRPLSAAITRLFQAPWFVVLSMVLILSGFVITATLLHSHWPQGPALLLYVMVTVWLADTGGYFAGKRFGKTKLAIAISPNKTWEGVAGAQVLALIWALLFFYTVGGLSLSIIQWLVLTAFIVMISVVGDLLESVFKRCFDKKDSGQLLPGHGGMLDRVDSLLAAVPVFVGSLVVLGA
jgi:phosphatidate cytidylyltransferase